MVQIQSLVRKLPHAAGTAKKKKKDLLCGWCALPTPAMNPHGTEPCDQWRISEGPAQDREESEPRQTPAPKKPSKGADRQNNKAWRRLGHGAPGRGPQVQGRGGFCSEVPISASLPGYLQLLRLLITPQSPEH